MSSSQQQQTRMLGKSTISKCKGSCVYFSKKNGKSCANRKAPDGGNIITDAYEDGFPEKCPLQVAN